MKKSDKVSDNILISLRRIIRAVDLHSRQLVQKCGLTGPQLVVLRELDRVEQMPIGGIAKLANLSGATVTGIVDRLEKRQMAARVRGMSDRRQVFVQITDEGRKALRNSPPLLQERFGNALQSLESWEQAQLLASLERIARMMHADAIAAEPILSADEPLNGETQGDAALDSKALAQT
ncbi:MAG: putative HTH-type transcriptional regulator YusO [candidate division BRC1 bacterium ADurb.BinA364]|nr:MAG: putative HTH-type transcriptional regulator YusO [candidate division BRC1 bacterium ADurb.BinA364]